MIKLTNLNAQFSIKITEGKSYLFSVATSQSPPIIKSSTSTASSLEWDDIVTLKYSNEIQFQIKQSNQTQQNVEIWKGIIKVGKKADGYQSWEIMKNNDKIGYLFGRVERLDKFGKPKKKKKKVHEQGSQIHSKSHQFKLHLLSVFTQSINLPKWCFLQFSISPAPILNTRLIKPHYSQLQYQHQFIQLPRNISSSQIVVILNGYDVTRKEKWKIATGKTQLRFDLSKVEQDDEDQEQHSRSLQDLKIEKIYLHDEEGEERGWVSFKHVCTSAAIQQPINPKHLQQLHNHQTLDPNFPLAYTSSPLKKAMSPTNPNSKIFMPVAARFSQHPKHLGLSDRVGIAHSSLKWQAKQSIDRYRVASFGKGGRNSVQYDKHIPGVGKYHLPSVFDKYTSQ